MGIAMCAQTLVHEDPFQDHPANKDLPDNAANRQSSHSSPGPYPRVDHVVSLGRLCRRPDQMRKSVVLNLESGEAPEDAVVKVDVDEVFRRFTPRLREISEEQALESRSTPAETGGLASAVVVQV